MRRFSPREANQRFSSYIADAESGETLVLLRRVKPVARIVPYRKKDDGDPEHEAAVGEL